MYARVCVCVCAIFYALHGNSKTPTSSTATTTTTTTTTTRAKRSAAQQQQQTTTTRATRSSQTEKRTNITEVAEGRAKQSFQCARARVRVRIFLHCGAKAEDTITIITF